MESSQEKTGKCENCKYRSWSAIDGMYWCKKWDVIVLADSRCEEYEPDDRKIRIADEGEGAEK